MPKYGFFINPIPTNLSDLVNDRNFLSIREYELTADTLRNQSTIAIDDIFKDSTVFRISLDVKTPFNSQSNPFIEVSTNSGIVLMNRNCNDPSEVSNYESDCYFEVQEDNSIQIIHNLLNTTQGEAILRIELFEVIREYEVMHTSDGKNYLTKDNKQVSVDVV